MGKRIDIIEKNGRASRIEDITENSDTKYRLISDNEEINMKPFEIAADEIIRKEAQKEKEEEPEI